MISHSSDGVSGVVLDWLVDQVAQDVGLLDDIDGLAVFVHHCAVLVRD